MEQEISKDEHQNYQFPSTENYNFMLKFLKTHKGVSINGVHPSLKQRIQDKYEIRSIGGNELICSQSSHLPLLIKEDAQNVILAVHSESHYGVQRTYKKIKSQYHHVPFELVRNFIESCMTCNSRQVKKKPPAGNPIICNGIMERVQADLIDMSSSPDLEYKYILQVNHRFRF